MCLYTIMCYTKVNCFTNGKWKTAKRMRTPRVHSRCKPIIKNFCQMICDYWQYGNNNKI